MSNETHAFSLVSCSCLVGLGFLDLRQQAAAVVEQSEVVVMAYSVQGPAAERGVESG